MTVSNPLSGKSAVLSVDNALRAFNQYIDREKLTGSNPLLYEALNYMLLSGGKRLRPVLTLLGAGLFTSNWQTALPQALAVELFHNFTLAHDDIMDNAPMRRNQPTLHKRYGQNTAILSGDLMLILSLRYLRKAPLDLLPDLFEIYESIAEKICAGQQMDLDFETEEHVTMDKYIRMISYKTAVLLGACLQIGSLMGGASRENAGLLYEFGLKTGITFQLMDDYLDAFGDESVTGKAIGGDIMQRKKTFLWIKSLEIAGEAERKELKELFLNNNLDISKVQRIIHIYKKLGIPELCREMMEAYYRDSLQLLENVDAPLPGKAVLQNYVNQLLHRIQ